MLKDFLRIVFTVSICIFSLSIYGTEIHVLNEFGQPLKPDIIFINGHEINNPDSVFSSDNGALILSKGYLPFRVEKTRHNTFNAYMTKRNSKPISVNTEQPVFVIIQNSHYMDYYESHLYYSDVLLPEFSKDERVYIYSTGYFPELILNYDAVKSTFELAPAAKWFWLDTDSDLTEKELFENNITPDGYITAEKKNVITFNTLAFLDISHLNSGDSLQLGKSFNISFAPFDSHYNFRILKDKIPLKPSLYKLSNYSIKGLSSGNYTIHVLYGGRICRVFSPVILNTRDIFLGPLKCSLINVQIRVLNTDSLPVTGALIRTDKDSQNYKTDGKGHCSLSLLSDSDNVLMVSKKGYSNQTLHLDAPSYDQMVDVILYKGAEIIVHLPDPDITLIAKGICTETGEPVDFEKIENRLKASHLNPGHFQINFMDVNTGLSRTFDLELYDEEIREIFLEDIIASLSGTISPVPPSSINTGLVIQLSGLNGQSRSDIHEDGSFNLSGITPGTYALSVKTSSLKTLFFNPEYVIEPQDENLTIDLEGTFWEGEIILDDSMPHCRVIFKDANKKTIISYSYESGENLLFIPDTCSSVEFVLSNQRKKVSSEQLKSTDSLFLW